MIAGRYTLEREVGRGGMGAVWLARDEVLGRAVAVKRIGMVPGGGTPDLERAQREARLAARLNHPHVVAVFDLVTEDDARWLVMEYVEGVTLAELVRREGPLDADRAVALLGQAADALAAAHSAGIVHRDVKPSNILVTDDGQVKLSDFGIARAEADASLTQTGLVTGSPAYLAPEVASGEQASAASDVWSLGATLFHALSGHPPYEVGGNLMGALYRIVHEDPPRLEGAGRLAPLLEHTMTRSPSDRWSMERVREALATGAGTAPPAAAATLVEPAPARPEPEETRAFVRPVTPAPADATPPAPAPAAHDDAPPHRRRGAFPVLVAVAVALLVGIILWAALSTRGPGEAQDPAGSESPSPTETSEPAAAPTEDGMEGFMEEYLATAPAEPAAAFRMLTPDFQAASGGLEGYRGFWGTIRTADLVSFSADPEALTVDYTVEYLRQDGQTVRDDVSLALVYQKGDYRIAGES